jgi:hypothetical protein
MTKNKNRGKAQNQKPRNQELNRAMLELRQGSRTMRIPSGKAYRRPAPGRRWE